MSDTKAFDGAVRLLPERLRKPLLFLPPETRQTAEELRLRCGGKLSLTLKGGVLETDTSVTAEDVRETLDRASQYSFHTVQESMKQGFLTAQDGYRIGLGGSVIVQNGQVQGFRTVSSLCIRIPHPVDCLTAATFDRLRDRNVLIYSAPGAGKTTLLRELIRRTSEAGRRVSLVDERGEIAAMFDGVPRFPVGRNTDILEFCPKAEAAELLLRAMNPEFLAVDELTAREYPLLERLRASGVRILATAHADSRASLRGNGLNDEGVDCFIHIRLRNGARSYEFEEGNRC